MLILILGLILFFVPFLLVNLFDNKTKGFVYMFFLSLLFETTLAVLIQSLGLFYYWVEVSAIIICYLAILFLFRRSINFKRIFSFPFKIDWVLASLLIISFLSLYQIHYNYTGEMTSATDNGPHYHQVKNMVYAYPYFSDEWYAVSLVNGAIDNHSLPVINTLNDTFFPNLELLFHSLIAQITVVLGLSALTQYTAISIFFNVIIILLIYLFLRINKVSKLVSAICTLFSLYITCAGNLPGLWHLIPFTLGIIFFLLVLCFAEFNDLKMVAVSAFIGLLFYPPLAPFYIVEVIIFLLSANSAKKENIIKISIISICSIIVFAYVLKATPLAWLADYVLSRIFFESLSAPFVPATAFYDIIPTFVVLLSIVGLYPLFKDKKQILISELILGVVFWVFCSLGNFRFFIEYERVVVITSIITVIISGFGLAVLEKYVNSKFTNKYSNLVWAVEVIALSFFFIASFQYPNMDNWKKIISVDPYTNAYTYAKSPINNYLTADDLNAFSKFSKKKFLSLPWKGTVIGIATDNYPVLIKQGTISLGNQNDLSKFLNSGCGVKNSIAKKLKVDYIYLYKFDCQNFKQIFKSKEGLYLYEFADQNI